MLHVEAGQLREERARLSEQVSAADQSIAREQARLDDELGRLREAFASQSQVVMEKAVSQLAEMSGRQGEERDRTLRATVAPVSELLARFEQHVHEVEKDRKESYGSISSQVDSLRRSQEQLTVETKNLVTALRRPQTRGRWGELQLRKVVEMAGMTEHCDFDEQPSLRIDDDALQRPDLVVHLPDKAEVVVDAKVPLSAYLDAIEAIDDEVRTQQLRAHANQVRTHVQKLASKEYWRQFQNSPDFVVCFVPGDALLSAAFEADPTLTEYALANKVLLTGPTALIALLQTVSYGWRQERLARNTQEIQQLAEQLYNRLGKFANHLAKLRSSLDRAVGSYNDAVSSLETRLLPTARRLRAVGVGDDDGELAVPRPITTRAVTAGAPELEVQERIAEELDA
jgi:DNA recombination protein RmuC